MQRTGAGKVIPPIEISMDARMVLAKMCNIFERERGSRIKLSRDDDVVGLINYGWETLNHEYLRLFERFCSLLSPEEIRDLDALGARIYRGAVVREQGTSAPETNPGQVVYRGTVIGGETGNEQAKKDEGGRETPKRVYRGRIVDD